MCETTIATSDEISRRRPQSETGMNDAIPDILSFEEEGEELKEHLKRILPTKPLDKFPTLVLNADFRPLSYYPLSIWSWQDAIKASFLDRVNIIAEYDFEVKSPSFSMRLPSVVGLKSYVKPAREPAFTRFNVFLRDSFTCQYCGASEDLTFDHVLPRHAGGQTTWENILTACSGCNVKKGKYRLKDIKMTPRQMPYKPTIHDLHNKGRKFPPNYLHESWMDYLYWDSELEP